MLKAQEVKEKVGCTGGRIGSVEQGGDDLLWSCASHSRIGLQRSCFHCIHWVILGNLSLSLGVASLTMLRAHPASVCKQLAAGEHCRGALVGKLIGCRMFLETNSF